MTQLCYQTDCYVFMVITHMLKPNIFFINGRQDYKYA